MAKSIKSVTVCHRNRARYEAVSMAQDSPVKYIEVRLSDKQSFDIEIDDEGDVVITGSKKIKILVEDENLLIFKM